MIITKFGCYFVVYVSGVNTEKWIYLKSHGLPCVGAAFRTLWSENGFWPGKWISNELNRHAYSEPTNSIREHLQSTEALQCLESATSSQYINYDQFRNHIWFGFINHSYSLRTLPSQHLMRGNAWMPLLVVIMHSYTNNIHMYDIGMQGEGNGQARHVAPSTTKCEPFWDKYIRCVHLVYYSSY